MAEPVGRDQNTEVEGQPLPAGEASSPKEEDKALNGHGMCGWVPAFSTDALVSGYL